MAVVAAAAVAVAAAEAIAAAVAVVDDSYSTIVAAAVAVADDGLHCLRTMLLLRICVSSFEYPQCRISAFASRSCLPTRVAP